MVAGRTRRWTMTMTTTTRPEKLMRVSSHLWGASTDSVFWDGWRTYGDEWARRYLRRQVLRGVDLVGDVTRSQLLGWLAA